MQNIILRINGFFQSIPEFVRANRLKMWLIFTALTVFFVIGAGRMRIDSSLAANLMDDNPARAGYNLFRSAFGSDEVLYIVYEAKDGNVFSKESLTALKKLQDELFRKWESESSPSGGWDRVTDIVTLCNVSSLTGTADSLVSRDFIESVPSDNAALSELKKRALAHPDYPLLLLSRNARYGGIVIRTNFGTMEKPAEDLRLGGVENTDESEFSFEEASMENAPVYQDESMDSYAPLVDSVRSVTGSPAYADSFNFYYAGNPELMTFLVKVLIREMGMIILGSMLLVMLVLFLLFRSPSAVLWPMLIVIHSIVWTIGTIGWSGLYISDFVNIIVFMLIAVGVADAIHILSGYLMFRREGQEHRTAVNSVYKKSGFACFLTSLTTAIGLFSMTAVPIVSMSRFGFFAGMGVVYAFIITVFMLPLMLDIMAPVRKTAKAGNVQEKPLNRGTVISSVLAFLEKFGSKKPVKVTVHFVLLGIILLAGIPRVVVDSNLVTIIREDQYIRKAFDVIDENMAGTGNIEFYIDTKKENGCKDPAVLKAIDSFQRTIEKKYPETVFKTLSLANIAKDSFRAVNEGKNSFYRIPDDPAVLAQTLMLFDGANPEDRRIYVTDDYRKTRVTVNTRTIGSRDAEIFMKSLKQDMDSSFASVKTAYPEMKITPTGQIPLMLTVMSYMSSSQLKSFALTFGIISVLMLMIFGSIRTGLISLLPNVLPFLSVFGIMGFLQFPLDLHTLLVIPIIIGISVDDTIHFITHFKLEYAASGDVEKSISNTYKEAGQAIIFTSLVLSAGYLIFIFAVNKGFSYFGILCSAAVFTAAMNDLIFLPALLRIFYKNRKVQKV